MSYREEGGRWEEVGLVGGGFVGGEEAREQVFTRTDQADSSYLEDESGGRGLLADIDSALSASGCTRLISGPSD